YLKDPRGFLKSIGIDVPNDCRIETTVENHDWLSVNTRKLAAKKGLVIICNVGGGNVAVARKIYRVVSFPHSDADIGKFKKKRLLSREEREPKSKSKPRQAKSDRRAPGGKALPPWQPVHRLAQPGGPEGVLLIGGGARLGCIGFAQPQAARRR